MKKQIILLEFMIFLFTVLNSYAEPLLQREEKQSLQLTIEKTFAKELGIIAAFRNIGDKTIILANPYRCLPEGIKEGETYNFSQLIGKSELTCKIRRPDGKVLILTTSHFNTFFEDLNGGSHDYLIIDPGEIKKVLLSKFGHSYALPYWYYYPDKPIQTPLFPLNGPYEISVSYKNILSQASVGGKIQPVWKGEVTSNTIVINITEPKIETFPKTKILLDKSVYDQGEKIEFTLYNNNSESIFIPRFKSQPNEKPIFLNGQVGFLERWNDDKESWERMPPILVSLRAEWTELRPSGEQKYFLPTEIDSGFFMKDDIQEASKHLDGNFFAAGKYMISLYYSTKQPLKWLTGESKEIACSLVFEVKKPAKADVSIKTNETVYNFGGPEMQVTIVNNLNETIYLARFPFETLQVKKNGEWIILMGLPHGIDPSIISQNISPKGNLTAKIYNPHLWINEAGKLVGAVSYGENKWKEAEVRGQTLRIAETVYLGCKGVGSSIKDSVEPCESKRKAIYSNEFVIK